jgi:hypothetical protein
MAKQNEMKTELQSRIKREGNTVTVDADCLYYRDLNCILREVIKDKTVEKLNIINVCGQRSN